MTGTAVAVVAAQGGSFLPRHRSKTFFSRVINVSSAPSACGGAPQKSSSMLKLLLRLLAFEAPQDSRGSDAAPPRASPIRMSPRPCSPVSPTSDIRSAEKTVDTRCGSSSSTKLRASRPRDGVTREEEEEEGDEEGKGRGNCGESSAWGPREDDELQAGRGAAVAAYRRDWSSSS